MKINFKTTNPLAPKAEYSRKTDVLSVGKKATSFFKPILKVVILLLLSVTIYRTDAAKCDKVAITIPSLRTGGSIVVIDDYTLEVTTNDGSTIESIQVYLASTLVYAAKGCDLSTCEYDLSSIGEGRYDVYVQTSSGEFSGPISIK
jgi:hypothetical protein